MLDCSLAPHRSPTSPQACDAAPTQTAGLLQCRTFSSVCALMSRVSLVTSLNHEKETAWQTIERVNSFLVNNRLPAQL